MGRRRQWLGTTIGHWTFGNWSFGGRRGRGSTEVDIGHRLLRLGGVNVASPAHSPRLLAVELWGLGDLAIAIPFLRAAAEHARVTLVAKPHAAALLGHFAPAVELVPFIAPWTAFTGKYQLARWPWRAVVRVVRELRQRRFDIGVSARPDPRDHGLLALTRATRRIGFPRAGSSSLLTDPLPRPADPHRAAHWRALAAALGWTLPAQDYAAGARNSRKVVIHTGAGQTVREWPRDRFVAVADRLRAAGWEPVLIDAKHGDDAALIQTLAGAGRFIGNDSGPGHIAALLGVPTFTIFGPQLPELFAPVHPNAGWIAGQPCDYKPCFDACRYPAPHCLLGNDLDTVWARITEWIGPRC